MLNIKTATKIDFADEIEKVILSKCSVKEKIDLIFDLLGAWNESEGIDTRKVLPLAIKKQCVALFALSFGANHMFAVLRAGDDGQEISQCFHDLLFASPNYGVEKFGELVDAAFSAMFDKQVAQEMQ